MVREVREKKTFRGHVSKSFQFIGVEVERLERSCDPEFSETRLTVLGDEDVVLGVFKHQYADWLICLVYLPE